MIEKQFVLRFQASQRYGNCEHVLVLHELEKDETGVMVPSHRQDGPATCWRTPLVHTLGMKCPPMVDSLRELVRFMERQK